MQEMYAMVQLKRDAPMVVGSTIFSSWKPWQEWRLATALHIISVGKDRFGYERRRYRTFGNFFKIEPQYTSNILEDRTAYFPKYFSYPGYEAVQIGISKCIFKAEEAQHLIGKSINGGKVHALLLEEQTMWNGTKYLAVLYLCSSREATGLIHVMPPLTNKITMDMETLRQHNDKVITCLNCLRKLA